MRHRFHLNDKVLVCAFVTLYSFCFAALLSPYGIRSGHAGKTDSSSPSAQPQKTTKHTRTKPSVFSPLLRFTRERAAQKTQPKRFPKVEGQRWKIFLQAVERQAASLSKKTLLKVRKTLEVESDKDRNRYTHFPSRLSQRIIQNMVRVSLKIGLFRARRRRALPRRVAKRPRPKTRVQSTFHSFAHAHAKSPKGTPASELPTLVFTQKDLARFQPPTTRLVWPIKGGRIGSGFGWRSDPFTGRKRFHGAVDIGAPFGTPIYAAAGGVVVRTGWMSSCGMGIIIRHSPKMKTFYCHLSQLLTSRGAVVSRGQWIGRVGSTGRSTSPHLHFVVSLYGRAVNPRNYLP